MSLDPPTYLNSLQNNIRARPIPWDGAVRAGTITDQDLKKIKAVDKVRKEQRRKTVEEKYGTYRDLLLGGGKDKSVLESASKRPDVIQYILVLAGDLMNGKGLLYLPKAEDAYEKKMFPAFHPSSLSTLNHTGRFSPSFHTRATLKSQYHS